MRSLISSSAKTRPDPAPSRWRYRYHRLMLTPGFRKLLKVGLPVLAVGSIIGAWAAHQPNRQMVLDAYLNAKTQIQQREEFLVKLMVIDGADEDLSADIRTVLPLEFPASSFELDLEEMRQTVAALAAVGDARLRVRPGGVLQVTITQRDPVAVMRTPDGLKLLDAEGVLIRPLLARADRPDLPLITGDGARDALAEGLALYEVAGPLGAQMRGVVRMGERRWDVILDTGQRILLPRQDPIVAFQRVVALAEAQDLLDRDVAVVDMRHPDRPTIRLNPQAVEYLRQITAAPEN